MRTIKNKMELVQAYDMNKTLRMIGTYAWIGAGVLFVSYIYFVGSITFSVIKQRGLEQANKGLISQMSKVELAYLNAQKDLTLDYASTLGLVQASANTVSFVSAGHAFAFNVGR